ncbi:bifunctional riboflavin kinase/FAD synthetase [Candidatus Pelagibacter bacterium]|nr:bifunctional riboflavin kinase/FAD synthetase [Candidatus Pelagibacter bacterium]
MKTYNNAHLQKRHREGVLAIGNFDGVHLGHQKVILDAKKKAVKNKLPFGIMTFEPMPVMFFDKRIKSHRINSLHQKINQFKKLKIDFLIIIKFNSKFSKLSAEQFIEKIIFKKTKCKFLYVSKNFRFGFKRSGSIKTLKKFEKKFNYKNLVIKPLKKKNKLISSTLIRKKIRDGQITEVNKLLNRNWVIDGKVIKGKKRGRKIGFPTCNLKMGNYVVPRLGVYAVKVKTSDFNKKGIANIGYRPTFNGQSLLLETNIFGINKNLYNKVISVTFKKFIRGEKKFKNIEYLKKQIKTDIKKAKNYNV